MGEELLLTDAQVRRIADVAIAWAREEPKEFLVTDDERRAARQIVNIGLGLARAAEKEGE